MLNMFFVLWMCYYSSQVCMTDLFLKYMESTVERKHLHRPSGSAFWWNRINGHKAYFKNGNTPEVCGGTFHSPITSADNKNVSRGETVKVSDFPSPAPFSVPHFWHFWLPRGYICFLKAAESRSRPCSLGRLGRDHLQGKTEAPSHKGRLLAALGSEGWNPSGAAGQAF